MYYIVNMVLLGAHSTSWVHFVYSLSRTVGGTWGQCYVSHDAYRTNWDVHNTTWGVQGSIFMGRNSNSKDELPFLKKTSGDEKEYNMIF